MKDFFTFESLDFNYIIGIDLGTTNSAVAYVDLVSDGARRNIRFFEIPQLVAAGEVSPRPILPSFLYLPGEYDLPAGSTALPWDARREYMVGEFAREQGARVPGRLVSSAKSWLCHAGVDRTSPILPWGAADDIPKVSPVDAGMRYLQHIREAWDEQMGKGREEHAFDQQLIILTVPASFDEVARELTVTAAQKAGIPRVILVEEPLAAFYAWLSKHENSWQELMRDGQLVLVCDVGGGTTDFSIVGIREGEKGLRFNRLAVGEHLMLGGDNMDLALGRYLETQLLGQPGKLDPRRWHQLVFQCRKAKETLLGAPDTLAKMDISVMGTAGKLIADTLKGSLSQGEIQKLIFEGFFPESGLEEKPGEKSRKGLTEFGLPYVQDPSITRHMAAFWQGFQSLLKAETGRETVYPDFILFNGGALTPASVRQHLRGIIRNWFTDLAGGDWTPEELSNPRPEMAVAIGAAYYGMVRLGEGVRVGSGSPRAYYVGVNLAEQAAEPETRSAVCLVPRGTEEGFEIHLDQLSFEALANQPVAFQLYTSSTRLGDQLAEVVNLEGEEITVLPPIRTVLRYGKKETAKRLPVDIAVRLTEIGTLELWCQAKQSEHRWQLQFDVRQDADLSAEAQSVGETVDAQLIEAARGKIRATFEGNGQSPQLPPERLMKALTEALEMKREAWPTPLIRKLADTLFELAEGRDISAAHEARWLNLLGYCLRPGYGDALDEWRMKQAWKIFLQGLQHPRQAQCRSDWWTFWRRVAGGLTPGKQLQIYQQLLPSLQASLPGSKKKAKKRLNPQEELEAWMALANFERLDSEARVELGRMQLDKIRATQPKTQELWAISRFGERSPMYGPLDRLVPAEEVTDWIETLLAMNIKESESLANALVQMGRLTGDRSRDIPTALRERIADWLSELPKADSYKERLLNPRHKPDREETDWIFGESLPAGLVLTTSESE